MNNEEVTPLTEEAIIYTSNSISKHKLFPSIFKKGAQWAKERSDAYWKQRLFEEVEKAFEAGEDYRAEDYESWHRSPRKLPNSDAYISKLKEKYK